MVRWLCFSILLFSQLGWAHAVGVKTPDKVKSYSAKILLEQYKNDYEHGVITKSVMLNAMDLLCPIVPNDPYCSSNSVGNGYQLDGEESPAASSH